MTAVAPGRDALIQSLAGAAGARAQQALLARAVPPPDADLVRRLHEAALRASRADLEAADRLARAAATVAKRLHDRPAVAKSVRTAGHILSLRGRYRAALAKYRSALDLLRDPADQVERAITLSGGLQTLIYLGDYDTAHAWAAEAREVFVRAGDTLRLGRLETNVGNVLYRQDRFREALASYREAHAAVAGRGDAQDVATILRNIAVCWISLNDFQAALDAHQAARAWCEEHGLPRLAAETDYNIAYLHYLRGEYAQALELYRATRAYCRRVGDPYHQALCDLDQSEIYLELNLNAQAGLLAAHACRAFRRLRMRYEMGKALVNMGASAARAGEARKALVLFERARQLFAQERNRHWLTITDLYRALVLSESGEARTARRLSGSALAYFEQAGPPGKAALCELLLGRLEFRAGRLERARGIVEQAIARAEGAEATALAAQGYFVLGEIHEALGDAEAAYAALRQAHAGLETLRSHIAGEQLKIAFLENKSSVYEGLVWLALQREPAILRSRVAFRYIEQAKSRSLADLLTLGPPPLREDDPRESAARAAIALGRELTWWHRRIEASEEGGGGDAAGEGASSVRARARDCEARFVRAQADLDQADAEFRVLGSGVALPLDVIRSAIPPDTAVLEYYETRGRLLGCVLTQDRLEILPLAPTPRVRTLLRLLQFQLSKFALPGDYAVRFAPSLLAATLDHLRELHEALVAPLMPHVRDARHLVVVPHRFLHYLPFHALFDGRQFLIDRASLSYAPSATVYYLCRARLAQPEPRSLVLAVPDPRAPHIADEVEAVRASLPCPTVCVGAAATADRLREEGRRSRYIHIATHGLFRQDNPMFSAVRLGNAELSLLDLYQLQLSADLVTLSGCGTGLSAVVGGDELVGLVRGLLYAGARALLVTLWDVHDRSTAAFMRSFYAHLQQDADMRCALRAAVQELRTEYPHPYFWAPFVLIGDAAGPALYQASRS